MIRPTSIGLGISGVAIASGIALWVWELLSSARPILSWQVLGWTMRLIPDDSILPLYLLQLYNLPLRLLLLIAGIFFGATFGMIRWLNDH